jgi:acetyl esterase/lipase
MKLYSLFLILFVLTACSSANSTVQAKTTPMLEPTATLEPTAVPSPAPAFDTAKYGSEDLDVTYCTPQEGMPQKMDIYYPKSGGPWPVFLYVHGGSWREGDKAEGEGWRGLNEQGYLVAAINYRMAIDGKFPVMIEDVKCAVRYLRAHNAIYNLDAERIGALGASAGGHLVGLLGTADETAGWDTDEYADQSSRVQAVVSMAGIFDLIEKLPSGLNASVYYAFGKLAGSGAPEMVTASPVTYITADDPPFLLLHGDNDGVVPVEQSEIFHAKLIEAGVPATLIVVHEGNHGLQGPEVSPSQEEYQAAINSFLEANLK